MKPQSRFVKILSLNLVFFLVTGLAVGQCRPFNRCDRYITDIYGPRGSVFGLGNQGSKRLRGPLRDNRLNGIWNVGPTKHLLTYRYDLGPNAFGSLLESCDGLIEDNSTLTIGAAGQSGRKQASYGRRYSSSKRAPRRR